MLVQTLPFPSLSPPPSKNQGGEQRKHEQAPPARAVSFLPGLFLHTPTGAHITARPWSGEGVGLLPRPVQELSFNKGLFFFFLNKTSKLFFVCLVAAVIVIVYFACPNYKP